MSGFRSTWSARFYWTGVVQIVAGGLVAAASGPLDVEKGSWLAAYLVLVGGVAQCAFGQCSFAHGASAQLSSAQFGLWNIGNLLVVIGTLATVPYVVDVGGVLLLPALLLAVRATIGATSRALLWAYRAVLLVLAVSIPIGLVLAHLRA